MTWHVKAILSDSHFWIPVIVLLIGILLLILLS
ncbi:MAG: translocated intimin receptor Tir [Acidobacteriaceae bacterium]|nr:translocated intimin receptor Tir [Acidobacteriaceae bacterium]